MTTADILNAAADLLESSPTAWTRGSFSRDASGKSVPPKDPTACSWCALGAIIKVAPDDVEAHLVHHVLQSKLRSSVASWNDIQHNKSDVVAKLRAETL